MTNRLGKIQSSSEQYLLQHRFGDQLEDDEVEDEELVKAFEEYKEKLKTAKLNMKNATKYVESFMARDDLTPQLKKITDDALIVVGGKERKKERQIQTPYYSDPADLRSLLEVFFDIKKKFELSFNER